MVTAANPIELEAERLRQAEEVGERDVENAR